MVSKSLAVKKTWDVRACSSWTFRKFWKGLVRFHSPHQSDQSWSRRKETPWTFQRAGPWTRTGPYRSPGASQRVRGGWTLPSSSGRFCPPGNRRLGARGGRAEIHPGQSQEGERSCPALGTPCSPWEYLSAVIHTPLCAAFPVVRLVSITFRMSTGQSAQLLGSKSVHRSRLYTRGSLLP